MGEKNDSALGDEGGIEAQTESGVERRMCE